MSTYQSIVEQLINLIIFDYRDVLCNFIVAPICTSQGLKDRCTKYHLPYDTPIMCEGVSVIYKNILEHKYDEDRMIWMITTIKNNYKNKNSVRILQHPQESNIWPSSLVNCEDSPFKLNWHHYIDVYNHDNKPVSICWSTKTDRFVVINKDLKVYLHIHIASIYSPSIATLTYASIGQSDCKFGDRCTLPICGFKHNLNPTTHCFRSNCRCKKIHIRLEHIIIRIQCKG